MKVGDMAYRRHRSALAGVLATVLGLVGALPFVATAARAATPCDPPVASPIACENSKPGNSSAEWDIAGAGDETIQGFSTDISVNKGQTVRFKIKTTANAYRIDIYRIGYYQGNGARKVATVNPSASLPQSQPACIDRSSTTGMVDCGNWAESASWAVPATAVSGIYIARLEKTSTGGASHIPFVVRDDASTSEVLFQTSDTTWQAYNQYGDTPTNSRSVYDDNNGRASKVSFNRPFTVRGTAPNGQEFLFHNEYPMVRWLEANGYDTTYTTDVDSDRRGALIKQHKIFLSVGHDEYWSGNQRANVEAARDAGVNLAFFSGNSVYWKTRFESSVDASATPYRTLVVYKETKANAKIDPDPAWTGTWRDPRFSPPSDGGRPENALMGTMFQVQAAVVPIKVPEADGKMRLWRNTSVASQAPGATATVGDSTLGFEWDEDKDNGFRPAGLFHLSTTTVDVDAYLLDYGSTVGPRTSTHNLTMYRAPSGAIVFGAGTIQWSWGLDENHDGVNNPPADVRIQQATANLFADMGNVQPATIRPGLTAATMSTDTTPATATITAPAAGATFANGTVATISGTATDAGGGQVGGVEVSTDNGLTWHPAVGRGSWTYAWQVAGSGPVVIRARATDDSGNIQTVTASRTVNAACPCRIFGDAATPTTVDSGDSSSIEVGVKLRSDIDGWITGVRFYKSTANTGTHVGSLWSPTGTQLATATFTGETGSGWQQVTFPEAVPISANATYIASYYAPNGRYSVDPNFFQVSGTPNAPLRALKDGVDGGNGVYRIGAGGGFPTQTFGSTNYWVDTVLVTTAPPDSISPSVVAKTPIPGASSIATSTPARATFNEPVQSGTIVFQLRDPVSALVPATIAYDSASRTATLTPTAPLAAGTSYTATLSGARDLAGNTMAAPATWTFRTAAAAPPPGVCPCSIWTDGTIPATPATTDGNSANLGVKFRADQDGFVDAIRFYKGPGNTGTHTGNLWTTTGTLLTSVTFSAESTEGWQQAAVSPPVAVTAGTTYVASYHAPVGRYAATGGQFTGGPVDNAPLHALANGTDGPNGVYLYGPAGSFPNQSFGATNYWVDVVFSSPPDVTAPTVASTAPGANATSVPVSTAVNATFNETVQAPTVTFTLKDAASATVAGSTSYNGSSRTASFTPSAPLAPGASYTATVSGARDNAGNTMASPFTWSFTTSGLSACPCSIFASSAMPSTPAVSDTSPVEVGVRFRSDADGYIYGLRFFKGPGNTGTHTGSIWSTSGTQLATATFSGESASGWQQVSFATAVAVTAGTTYVASYYAPAGRYAADSGFFNSAFDNAPLRGLANGADGPNGVYIYGTGGGFPTQTFGAANYWVDVSFSTVAPPDVTPPMVTVRSPSTGATSVPTSTTVNATFTEAVQPSTVTFTLQDAANVNVTGSASYEAATRTSTFAPGAALASNTSYTATVSGAKDATGNTMATPATWSFTTASGPPAPGVCPCSIWTDATVPGTPASTDTSAIELGVKFRADTNGNVTGIRFYKGVGNTGTHTGTLWSATGTALRTATFTAESASGWQQVTFSSPVAVTAGTTYVASYHAPFGRYAADGGYFNSATDNAPLHALANGVDGGNGVYVYGTGGFPSNSFGAANYWVDVVFSVPADVTAPTVTATVPAAGATAVPVASSVSATYSEPVQPGTVSFVLRDGANAIVAGSVAYDAPTRTSTFKPTASLVPASAYTATVSGARDAAGNVMTAPATWSFTTAVGGCPCTIFGSAVPGTPASGDTSAIELGVKFRSDVNGTISGVRFYKGAGNGGTHTGTLWNSAGGQLATATFTGETATGWQQVAFATPVAITAGTTYIASYYTPTGNYSADGGFFNSPFDNAPLHALANGVDGQNGLYRYGAGGGFPTGSFGATNYWVDVVFSPPPDTVAPTVTSTTPAPGATGVAVSSVVSATYSEAVQPATVSFVVRNPVGVAVAGAVSYDVASRRSTFTPTAALVPATTYTATVSGVKDTAGNTMAASFAWSFTT